MSKSLMDRESVHGLHAEGLSIREIATRTGISRSTIGEMLHPPSFCACGNPKARRATRCRKCRCHEEGERRRAREERFATLWHAGVSMKDIAAEFGTTTDALGKISAAARRRGLIPPEDRRVLLGHRNQSAERKRTRSSYDAMRYRCEHPVTNGWEYYGGRGVTVCERWRGPNGFENFLADMGERPEDKTLDRIDSDGHYEPGNCRWATIEQQAANRRPRGRAGATSEALANIV